MTILALALLVMPWPAQTHPCDTAAPTTFREPSAQLANLKLGWCFDAKDQSGNVIEGPFTFSVTIGSNAPIDLGAVSPLGSPNAQGYSFYQATVPGLAAGTIHMNVSVVGLGESADSTPITLTLLGPPKPPRDPRIDKSGG